MDKYRTLKIVGIDPGSHRIGYALLEGRGSDLYSVLTEAIIIPKDLKQPQRLAAIKNELSKRLLRDQPDAGAVERLYFAKNVTSAIAVAEARGVVLLTLGEHVRSIWEYTPLEVKLAVTGYGRADKLQVKKAVRALMPKAVLPASDDAIDAVALAITAMATGPKTDRRSNLQES